MKIVLDTNVLLSAFFGSGLCHALLERLLDDGDVTIVLSEHIVDEFREHAGNKFGAPAKDVADAVQLLRRAAEIVSPSKVAPNIVGDTDDLPVLGTVVAGRADALVTGDKELLAIGDVTGVPIITPRAMYERLGVT